MKVAHVVGKLKAAGVEAVVFNYLSNMDRTGMEIDVLYDADSVVPPPQSLVEAGIRFIEIPPYQKLPAYMKAVKRICRDNGYDIVHSHMNSLSGFPLLAAKRGGVGVRIAHSHTTSSKVEGKRDLLKRALRPFARRYATNFAACSAQAGRWLFGDKLFDEGKVTVFNNAVNIEKYKFSPEDRENLRRELGVGDRRLVLHIGRFMTQKNHRFIIEIFKELKKIEPDTVLVLVGEGPLEEEIKSLVREYGMSDSVIFKGIVPDAERYYSAADVFILPSLYEGLPVVAVEAQSAGLNCFVSDVVTRECEVTGGVRFIPLSAGAEKWAVSIASATSRDREADNASMENSVFNIKKTANDLKEYYYEICGRA